MRSAYGNATEATTRPLGFGQVMACNGLQRRQRSLEIIIPNGLTESSLGPIKMHQDITKILVPKGGHIAIIPHKSWQRIGKLQEEQCTNDLHKLGEERCCVILASPRKRPASPHAHNELVVFRLETPNFDLNGGSRGYPSDMDMTRHED